MRWRAPLCGRDRGNLAGHGTGAARPSCSAGNAGLIEDGTKLWRDICPGTRFPTLETRLCDIATRIEAMRVVVDMLMLIEDTVAGLDDMT